MDKIGIFVAFFLHVINVSALGDYNYFCSDSGVPQDLYILTETNRKIVTVRKGNEFYSPNETCVFPIETMEGYRIKLTVELSDLHTPNNMVSSYCDAYDRVDVMDGEDKKVVSWCGKDHPKEIISKGNVLKVVFNSNKDNGFFNDQYHGVRIGIRTFDNKTCPPGWLDFDESCYATTLTKSSWLTSQQECNQRQSNLVSVDIQESLTFLFKEILNKTSELYLWTGLNGVVEPDHLRWVDKSTPNKIVGFDIPRWDDRKRCGVIHTKQALMYMQDCHHHGMYALCQSKKNSITPLYPAKQTDTRFDIEEDNGGEVLLAVCIPIIIIIVLVIGISIALDVLGYSFNCFPCGPSSEVA